MSSVDSALSVSRMNFSMIPDINISVQKNTQTFFPQSSVSADGSNILYNLNTGTQVIDPAKSYMYIDLEIDGGDTASSIANIGALWSSIVIQSRQGIELSRLMNPGQYFIGKRLWSMTFDDRLMLAHQEAINFTFDEAVPVSGTRSVKFVMPLQFLPFFNPLNNVLYPPQVMSGLRMTFQNATVNSAFSSATPITAFRVRSELRLSCITLADSYTRRLNELSASSGLNILFSEAFPSSFTSNSTAVNFQVSKACTKALNVVVMCRKTSDINSATANSYNEVIYPYSSISCQSGATYYPNQPLLTASDSKYDLTEAYHYSLINASPSLRASVRYEHFYRVANNESVHYQSLLDGDTPMTGIVLNNSKSLNINANVRNTGPDDREYLVYLCHVRLARFFLNSSTVND